MQSASRCSVLVQCRNPIVGRNQFRWMSIEYKQINRSSGDSRITRNPDHRRLIDPLSLRNTLTAVREANRTTLIRKVTQDGKFYGLQVGGQSSSVDQELWLSDRFNKPESSKASGRRLRRVYRPDERGRTMVRRPLNGDYGGIAFPLQSQWQHSAQLSPRWRFPWLTHLKSFEASASVSAHARLTAEINAFTHYLTPTTSEQLAAKTAIDDIKAAFAPKQHSFVLKTIGSRETGLASPLADIDLNVSLTNGFAPDELGRKQEALVLLRRLVSTLRKAHKQKSNQQARKVKFDYLRVRARIPIITGYHLPTGLEFQIQHTNSGYNTMEYTKAFVREYPTLKCLFYVLKQMLVMRGLWGGRGGGLTSYPLIIMIVACLKLHANHLEKADVAGHLLSFLDMYSSIDFYSTGISVAPSEYIQNSDPRFKSSRQAGCGDTNDNAQQSSADSSEPGLEGGNLARGRQLAKSVGMEHEGRHHMFLMDPADSSNDLGRTLSMVKHFQATIIDLKEALCRDIQAWDSGLRSAQETRPDHSLLACLVSGDYKTFEVDRAALGRSCNTSQGEEGGSADNIDK